MLFAQISRTVDDLVRRTSRRSPRHHRIHSQPRPQSPSALPERLEDRRLFSAIGAAALATATADASAPLTAMTPAATAAAPAPLAGTFNGRAKLRADVRHAHGAHYDLSFTVNEISGALSGTLSITGFGDLAVSGTIANRRFTLSDPTGAQITGKVNRHETRMTGHITALLLNGQTYHGSFSARVAVASTPGTGPGVTPGALPRPDHVVIVVEENHSYGSILGDTTLPPNFGIPTNILNADDYIRSLAAGGASFTNASAETHPSQPNYLAMFSGSTQGVTSDATPGQPLPGPDLGGELQSAGLSFAGYSEDLPSVGYTGDTSGDYARKHNPWSDFPDVPATANLPFTQFPRKAADFANLPTVSFVIPNQQNDMHSNSIAAADQWLKDNLSNYANWAKSHNSLLIVTWDEGSGDNNIATIFYGQSVKPGNYPQPVNHYNMLRTLEDMYNLPPSNHAADVQPITNVWK